MAALASLAPVCDTTLRFDGGTDELLLPPLKGFNISG
jgi:hypothetical protein